jgi:beta-glucanase (GH16 family)
MTPFARLSSCAVLRCALLTGGASTCAASAAHAQPPQPSQPSQIEVDGRAVLAAGQPARLAGLDAPLLGWKYTPTRHGEALAREGLLTIPRRAKAAPEQGLAGAFRDDWEKLDGERWKVSGPWANGKTFGAGWKPENVRVQGGRLQLTLNNDRFDDKLPYSAGEIGTARKYGFGRYEVRMKPIKNPGVISSFFTYTSQPRHDEIDIEFVGNNTSVVEFTYYTGGKVTAVARHPLGFDAAEAFHDYAFEWRRDSITWFVDGKQAARATFAAGTGPEFAGAILMNAWPTVGADEWAGKFEYPGKPLVAEYEWVRWTPLQD